MGQYTSDSKPSIEQNNEKIFRLLAEGKLQTEPLLTHVVSPEDAPDAYQAPRNRDDAYLGVIIEWESH